MTAKTIKIVFLLTVLVNLAVSCDTNNDCEAILPIEPTASFSVVDSNGVNLIGEELTYQFEDIRIYNDTSELFLYFENTQEEAVLYFDYTEMVSGEAYSLQLSASETDALVVDFFIREGDCFDMKLIDKVTVNDNQIEFGTQSFVIVK
ncbi:hypothetical protein [Ulvibacter litoralis]|uniref:Uncharacterized protein n=1 Tax=Ulvibacter litoralis TaxID=227084 RepID=A0A1G7FAR1_9FLAO|nr:hypothetical protein [Ulvibacter litoralis]GHC51951.1 hypothetical protein GCM10008083_14600 [Ulvibacter litoralis]SDE73023.1 hypothetical protein SAMN05421855_102443 [Ulvibacter litoralis]